MHCNIFLFFEIQNGTNPVYRYVNSVRLVVVKNGTIAGMRFITLVHPISQFVREYSTRDKVNVMLDGLFWTEAMRYFIQQSMGVLLKQKGGKGVKLRKMRFAFFTE